MVSAWICTTPPPSRRRTTSSSSAPAAPARRRRCCSPGRASTSSSSTGPSCPSDTLSTHAIARGGVVQLARWGLLDDVLASGAPPIRVARRSTSRTAASSGRSRTGPGVDYLARAPPPHPRRHPAGGRRGGGRDRADRRVGHRHPDRRDAVGSPASPSATATAHDAPLHARVRRRRRRRPLPHRPQRRGPHASRTAARPARPPTPTSPASTPTASSSTSGDRAFAGVFPTHDGEANVWVCTARPTPPCSAPAIAEHVPRPPARRRSPSLAERVAAAPDHGAAAHRRTGLPNHVLEAAGPGWALVGDAGYHRDPITGPRHHRRLPRRRAPRPAPAGQLCAASVPEAEALAALRRRARPRARPDLRRHLAAGAVPAARRSSSSSRSSLSVLIDAEADRLADLPRPRPVRAAA